MQSFKYEVHSIGNFNKTWSIPEKITVAIIDEDFNGENTGWKLAKKIRQLDHRVKIIMIVRKNPKKTQTNLYDSVRGFPISGESLIAAIEDDRNF